MKNYREFINENYFGHDNESEIFTIIKRMREGSFKILECIDNKIYFEIEITHTVTVPVSNTYYFEKKFIIEREDSGDSYNYIFSQVGGDDPRKINIEDGWIIWSLLEEKM